MIINSKKISSNRAYIIAEIAGNFNNLDEARTLIDKAKYCGVDAVKLQTYRAETLVSKKAIYEMENTGNVGQYELFKQGELSCDDHKILYKYASECGLDIFSTPSHISDVYMLEDIGTTAYKIGSDDSSNLDFIEKVAMLNKPLLIATGMRTIFEVDEVVQAVIKTGNQNFSILHATTSYPTKYDIANLEVIKSFIERYPGVTIGYSDHTIGWQCSYAARVLGATIIERHFTLDRDAEGPDHILSSTPDEMKLLVDSIRIFERARGTGIKMPLGQEIINRKNNGKSIVLERDVLKGDRLTRNDLSVKRPGYGIEPKYLNNIIGRVVVRQLNKDDVLNWEDLGE